MTSYVEKPDYVYRQVEGLVVMASIDPLKTLADIWSADPATAVAADKYYRKPDGVVDNQNNYVVAIIAAAGLTDDNAFMQVAGGKYLKVSEFRTAAQARPVVAAVGAGTWDPDAATPAIAANNSFTGVYAPAVQKSMPHTQAAQMVSLNTGPFQGNVEQTSANSRSGMAAWGKNTLPSTVAAIAAIKAPAATAATVTAQIIAVGAAGPDLGVANPHEVFKITTAGAGQPDGYLSFPAPDTAGYWQPPANAADNPP